MQKAFLLIVYLLFGNSLAFSQVVPQNPDLLKIRSEIIKMVTDSIIPSMAVSVVKEGEIMWEEAIGYSDIEKQEKASLNSLYPLGSVSKSITATGVMHLINTGQLGLFDNVQDLVYPVQLKNMDGKIPSIKLWQLLSQNSGLNHGYGVYDHNHMPQTADEIKNFYESTTIIAFNPGEVYHYSNHSFDIAELIIDKVTGKSFQDYMNENIFYPLNMNNTFAYPDFSANNNFVSTYSTSLKKLSNDNIIFPAGGAGFWSSIQDLTQYALFHMGEKKNDQVISEENLKLMHEFRQGPGDMFGMGWFNPDGNLYSDGNVSGGNAVISIDKQNNLAIICLLNKTSNDGIADQVCGKISEVFIKKENNSFNEWRRIYGTPYQLKYDLVGSWNGTIEDPVSSRKFAIKLLFDKDGKIFMDLENQNVELIYAKYNLFQELSGHLEMNIPDLFDNVTDCSLTLKRDKNIFYGYMFYGKSSEYSFYTMPLFVRVKKEN